MRRRLDDLSHKQSEYLVLSGIISFTLLLGSLVVEFGGIYDIYNIPSPPYDIPSIIGGIGAAASVLVSILLLYVYDRQREILSEQKDLTEYQQTSLLNVEDHTLIDYTESKEYQQKNHSSTGNPDNLVLYQTEYMEVDISNVGLAPAHDLRVELYVKTEEARYSASLPLIAGHWKEVVSDLHTENKSSIFLNSDGNAIGSDSEVETHTVPLAVLTEYMPDDWRQPYDLHRWPPANSVVRCAEESVDHIGFE